MLFELMVVSTETFAVDIWLYKHEYTLQQKFDKAIYKTRTLLIINYQCSTNVRIGLWKNKQTTPQYLTENFVPFSYLLLFMFFHMNVPETARERPRVLPHNRKDAQDLYILKKKLIRFHAQQVYMKPLILLLLKQKDKEMFL